VPYVANALAPQPDRGFDGVGRTLSCAADELAREENDGELPCCASSAAAAAGPTVLSTRFGARAQDDELCGRRVAI